MGLRQVMGQTCRIYAPTTVSDLYGDSTRRVYPTAPTATHPCRLQLAAGSEDRDSRDAAAGSWRLYLPGDAELGEHDQVEVDDQRFDVISIYRVDRPGRGACLLQVLLRSYAGTVPGA